MASPLFQIAGNIKQQFLPFVINPNAKLHKFVSSNSKLNTNGAGPQYFTYKNYIDKSATESGTARLHFYPSSLNDTLVDNDISYKLLYGNTPDIAGDKTESSLSLQSILSKMPGVQIREYLPDTRLDQCINIFTDLFKNMAALIKKNGDKKAAGDDKTKKNENDDSMIKKLWNVACFTIQYMVGATDPDFYNDMMSDDKMSFPFSSYKSSVCNSRGKDGKTSPGFYVMTFPYILYYRLQSCVTTNIYEIPGSDNNKCIIQSNGSKGWTDGGSDFMSAGGFRVSGLLSKIPVIGNIANMILGNIGINYMPWWNAEKGAEAREAEIAITFDLYNDSAKAAMDNFIFVNTIAPNNRWIQYNMFQHSPCIYDVKLEGINRLFACACDATVKYEGVLRDPPQSWINELANCHLNLNMDKASFRSNAIQYKLIKIPDVYKVELKFTSLLPANFNTFLFNYAENANHINKYSGEKASGIYQQSEVSKLLSNAMAAYMVRVGKVWDGSDPTGTSDDTQKAVNKEKARIEKERQEQEAQQKAAEQAKEDKAKTEQIKKEQSENTNPAEGEDRDPTRPDETDAQNATEESNAQGDPANDTSQYDTGDPNSPTDVSGGDPDNNTFAEI